MIRCIQIGTTTVQGEYIRPGVVRVFGKLFRGLMIGRL